MGLQTNQALTYHYELCVGTVQTLCVLPPLDKKMLLLFEIALRLCMF
jgi:hypothetical protein